MELDKRSRQKPAFFVSLKNSKMKDVFYSNGLIAGRLISGSKSGYRDLYPDNEVYFNANVFVLGEGKIWHGDLDITKDREILLEIAREIGKDLFILREMDGRFENEERTDSDIIKFAVHKVEI
jgi:hypothetical protein